MVAVIQYMFQVKALADVKDFEQDFEKIKQEIYGNKIFNILGTPKLQSKVLEISLFVNYGQHSIATNIIKNIYSKYSQYKFTFLRNRSSNVQFS